MTKRTKEEVYKDLEGIFEVKKLEDYCEQIANDLEEEGEKFLTHFQAYQVIFARLTSKQKKEIIPFLQEEPAVLLFNSAVAHWSATVIEQQAPQIEKVMQEYSVSQGEAAVAADEAFSEQIGYTTSFVTCLTSAIIQVIEEVKNKEGD